MFDIGFSELVVVGIIALVILGPERLPGALRTLGLWIGRLRRSFNNIRADIEREVGADEIRRQLRNEAIMEKIKNTRTQVTQSVESVKKEAEAVKKDLSMEEEFKGLTGEGRDNKSVTPPPPPGLAGDSESGAAPQKPAGTAPAASPEPPPAPPASEPGSKPDDQEKPSEQK